MTSGAYYNEHDPFAAAWLRELIRCGQIAPGDVDERSIEDVCPDDLRSYTQCHFFAGIGVWSYALRRAGWDDTRPIWTGSCPCQPFSAAGKGDGFADERHLWPAFFHLITQCGPRVVLGEQVASKDGLAWLDLVQADMENARYAFGALDICTAGFGAPHIRQRSWWCAVGLADREGGRSRAGLCDNEPTGQRRLESADNGGAFGMEHDAGHRWFPRWPEPSERGVASGCGENGLVDPDALHTRTAPGNVGTDCSRLAAGTRADDHTALPDRASGIDRLADNGQPSGFIERAEQFSESQRSEQHAPFGNDASRCGGLGDMAVPAIGDGCDRNVQRSGQHGFEPADGQPIELGDADGSGLSVQRCVGGDMPPTQGIDQREGVERADAPTLSGCDGTGPTNGFWRNADWLFCTDGKWRPVEPGTFPLVNGASNRVGTLRGYGNAIPAPVAQGFIEAVIEYLA